MPAEIVVIESSIEIDGSDTKVHFINLSINQFLADVNQFTFLWQMPEGEVTLENLMKFYQENLAKDLTISIGTSFTFKGIISNINCVNQSATGAAYEVKGYGQFIKLDQVKYANTFYKKTFKQIVESLNSSSDLQLKADPESSDSLFYTVQYNQSIFEFYKMMAIRYGEWMYYTGTEMKISPPSGDALELVEGKDLTYLNLHAKMIKTSIKTVGFDHFKGEKITDEQPALSSSGFIDSSLKAGEKALGDSTTNQFISNTPNAAFIEKYNTLKQKSALANSVQMQGQSYMPNIKIGAKIKVSNRGGIEIGEFIVTEIHHHCSNKTQYRNDFTAIPSSVEVPPYTNPDLFPLCNAQYAIVVENEDNDGLDRIKVRFPWQKESETTPWLSIVTPHAGKDKGFRFVPEKEDEVMISFIDQNAEKPFVLGAVHTEKNKSGNETTGNHIKMIRTRTGRKLKFDDDKGLMGLADFKDKDDQNGNMVSMQKKDNTTEMSIGSRKDDQNSTLVKLEADKKGSFCIMKGGDTILEITLSSDNKKILIKSKGDIEIDASSNLNLNASNININASSKVTIEGKQGVEIKGLEVKVKADTTAEIAGLTAKIKGDLQLDLSGGAMAKLQAPIVQIN